MKMLKLATLAILLSLSLNYAAADVVTSTGADWVLLPNSIGPNTGTWAMPAAVPNCGNENEPSCEPTGTFVVDHGFTTSGSFHFNSEANDPTGLLSDIITFGNNAAGLGEINFYSDPNLPANVPVGALVCTEDAVTGCIHSFTLTTSDGTTFTVSAASDGEATFDPFGFGFDSSDQIQFNGVTPNQTPEPSSLFMSLALLGVVALAQRVFQKLRA
jgi:hypothetical protein